MVFARQTCRIAHFQGDDHFPESEVMLKVSNGTVIKAIRRFFHGGAELQGEQDELGQIGYIFRSITREL